jgi:hypothetical protein
MDRTELKYRGTPFVILEVGGAMRSTWPNYFHQCSVLVVCLLSAYLTNVVLYLNQ